MGADIILTALWQRAGTELDWVAGEAAASVLSRAAVLELADLAPQWADADGELSTAAAREKAVAAVRELREHVLTYSRELTSRISPDGRWVVWLTGGMSWGDSPTELYDTITALSGVPEVLQAIGFDTRFPSEVPA